MLLLYVKFSIRLVPPSFYDFLAAGHTTDQIIYHTDTIGCPITRYVSSDTKMDTETVFAFSEISVF